MINWFSVVGNSFWIVGLALIVAGLSYYYWLAGQLGHSIRREFNNPRFQRIVLFGLLFVGIGLALTAGSLLQAVPAAALILLCAYSLISLLRDGHKQYPGG